MKKNRKSKKTWAIWFFLFLIGIALIILLPLDNRNLTIEIATDSNNYMFELGSDAISLGEKQCTEYEIAETEESILVKKVTIYGDIKTQKIDILSYGDFSSYLSYVDGEVLWTESGLIITKSAGGDKVHITLNSDFLELLRKDSSSRLQERIIFAGFYFVILFACYFILEAIKERKTEHNWNNHGPVFEVKKFIDDIRKYRQYMVYAAQTDLKAEVADSYLNRLWWLLEPFFNMLVYVIVFGRIMGNSVENYATFIFSALLMWNFFSKTVNYSVKLVRSNKDVISKVYIPKFIVLLSNMFLNLFKLVFSMLVLVAMLLIFKVHIGVSLIWFFASYIVIFLLAFGVGMIFLHFGVYVDDLSYAVGILINMLMFLSGIFYNTMTTLPKPLNVLMLTINPVASCIETMHDALLYNTATGLAVLAMWFFLSVILCMVGVHIVYKSENSYVKIV